MNYISALGKTLDQPLLVNKFTKAVPALLIGGSAAYGIYNTYKAPENKKTKTFFQNMLVLSSTVAAALVATKGLKMVKINIPGLLDKPKLGDERIITDFIHSNNSQLNSMTKTLLEKAKKSLLRTYS